jgi:hypothetical protein
MNERARATVNEWRGVATGLFAVREWCAGLSELPELDEGQRRVLAVVMEQCDRMMPGDECFKLKPTNATLARKYAVSLRTVAYWKRAGCPFDKGQWAVLDWLAKRREIPAGAREKFARQLARRREREQRRNAAAQWGALIWSVKVLERLARESNRRERRRRRRSGG